MLAKDGSRDEAIFQLRGTERGARIPGERTDNPSQHSERFGSVCRDFIQSEKQMKLIETYVDTLIIMIIEHHTLKNTPTDGSVYLRFKSIV